MHGHKLFLLNDNQPFPLFENYLLLSTYILQMRDKCGLKPVC